MAVVGMACRFPGAPGLQAFWDVLQEGRDTISRGLAGPPGDPSDLLAVDAFGVLDGIDRFDNRLFGVTAREASLLDPQQRVWLELVWHALEDAGLGRRPDLVTGVFAASNRSAYLEHNIGRDHALRERLRRHVSSETRQILNGNEREFLPLRTSFALDLHGPSVNVQTACSSALVAAASACRSLLSGEADVCVAGGVSIVRTSAETILAEPDAIHSVTGHCRPFDAAADGTVFGDGGGAVVLRRLSDALEDGQRIYALIRGWGIGNDGGAKASFVAPNAEAQATAIRKAWAMAETDAGSVSYVEAHGTGTRLGDPVEVEGLRRSLGAADRRCWIGSVKSSVGHLDTAAGMAGLIKTCLMLHRRTLVPTVGFVTPNPLLGLERTRFRVGRESASWSAGGGPLMAGVTALGVGGTNCHLALAEAPRREGHEGREDVSTAPPHLMTVSAATPAALERQLRRHAEHLSRRSEPLSDYCRSAARGRRHLKHRVAISGSDTADLVAELGRRANGPDRTMSGPPRLLFAFGGQLSSYAGMARGLHDAEPVFRDWIGRCASILNPLLDRPLHELMFLPGEYLSRTCYEQPVLCALQISLAEMWKCFGIRPAAVVGYSVGEFAAACCAGAVEPEEVLPLVARRGRMMEEIAASGFMLTAVGSVAEAAAACRGQEFEIAGTAGEDFCVLSGDGPPDAAIRALTDRGLAPRRRTGRDGFHTRWLDPCLPAQQKAVGGVQWTRPSIDYVSAATGRVEADLLADPEYWVGQARRQVRFVEALAAARAAGCDLGLEIGPGGALGALAEHAGAEFAWLHSLDRARPDRESVQRCLAGLYEAGAEIDWLSVHPPPGPWVDLPDYSFDRDRFWIGPDPAAPAGSRLSALQLDAGQDGMLDLQDHRLFGRIVIPASHHLASALNAIAVQFGCDDFTVEDWTFLRPLILSEESMPRAPLTLILEPLGEGPERYSMEAREGSGEAGEAVFTAEVTLALAPEAKLEDVEVTPSTLDRTSTDVRDGADFYDGLWVNAGDTGPAFRRVERVWSAADRAVAAIAPAAHESPGILTAPVIEAGFQCLHAGTTIETPAEHDEQRKLWVPFSFDRVRYRRLLQGVLRWCCATHHPDRRSGESAVGTISYHDAAGRCALLVEGFHLRPLHEMSLDTGDAEEPTYRVALEKAPERPEAPPDPASVLILTADVGTEFAHWAGWGAATIVKAREREVWNGILRGANAGAGRLRIAFVTGSDDSGCTPALGACKELLELALALGDLEPGVADLAVCTLWPAGAPDPASAAVEGMARVLMNEHPDWGIRLVSVGGDSAPGDRARHILGELAAARPGEHVVHLDGRRLRRVLRPAALPQEAARLRPDRAYLVVGPPDRQTGLLADWLIANGAGHVRRVVVGAAPAAPKAAGSSSDLVVLDPAAPDIAGALSGAACPHPVAGIFFLPWGAEDGLVQLKTWERFDAETGQCAAALAALSAQSETMPLDHFVCFSSSAAVLGLRGQVSYAALTSVVDALCAERQSRGLPGLAIDWGPWHQIGRWTRTDAGRQAVARQGWRPLAAERALTLLGRAMAGAEACVAVLPVDWQALVASGDADGSVPVRRLAPHAPPRTDPPGESARGQIERVEPGPIERTEPGPAPSAVGKLSALLGEDLSGVPPATLLVELGLDSLMAVALRNALRRTHGADVALGRLLAGTTLGDLRRLDAAPPQSAASG